MILIGDCSQLWNLNAVRLKAAACAARSLAQLAPRRTRDRAARAVRAHPPPRGAACVVPPPAIGSGRARRGVPGPGGSAARTVSGRGSNTTAVSSAHTPHSGPHHASQSRAPAYALSAHAYTQTRGSRVTHTPATSAASGEPSRSAAALLARAEAAPARERQRRSRGRRRHVAVRRLDNNSCSSLSHLEQAAKPGASAWREAAPARRVRREAGRYEGSACGARRVDTRVAHV